VRDATAEDIARLDSLTLDDFDADFSAVRVPEKADGERLTHKELREAADDFLASLQAR
jgi:hypothetical protein